MARSPQPSAQLRGGTFWLSSLSIFRQTPNYTEYRIKFSVASRRLPLLLVDVDFFLTLSSAFVSAVRGLSLEPKQL